MYHYSTGNFTHARVQDNPRWMCQFIAVYLGVTLFTIKTINVILHCLHNFQVIHNIIVISNDYFIFCFFQVMVSGIVMPQFAFTKGFKITYFTLLELEIQATITSILQDLSVFNFKFLDEILLNCIFNEFFLCWLRDNICFNRTCMFCFVKFFVCRISISFEFILFLNYYLLIKVLNLVINTFQFVFHNLNGIL